MNHKTDRIAFEMEGGTPGVAVILIIPLPDGRTLVACSNEDEENDAPVNAEVEQLFRTVCQRHGLDPAKVVWTEYTGEIFKSAGHETGGWELVSWHDGLGKAPDWRQMTPDDWTALGTTPPPGPRDLPKPRRDL